MHIEKEQIKRVFNLAAEKFDRIGTPFFDLFGKALVEFADIKPGSRVLDIACGSGAAAFPAADAAGIDGLVNAIDFSEQMIAECEKKISEKSESSYVCSTLPVFQVMDAEQLDFDSSYFDYVLCGFGLFFLPDPEKGLSEIHRVLKPGGKFAFSTWNWDRQSDWTGKLLRKYLPQMPAYEALSSSKINMQDFSNLNGIEKILELTGFKKQLITQYEVVTYYDSPEDWLETRWHTSFRIWFEQLSGTDYIHFKNDVINALEEYLENDKIKMTLSAWLTGSIKPL